MIRTIIEAAQDDGAIKLVREKRSEPIGSAKQRRQCIRKGILDQWHVVDRATMHFGGKVPDKVKDWLGVSGLLPVELLTDNGNDAVARAYAEQADAVVERIERQLAAFVVKSPRRIRVTIEEY